jgi:hypothetical protein
MSEIITNINSSHNPDGRCNSYRPLDSISPLFVCPSLVLPSFPFAYQFIQASKCLGGTDRNGPSLGRSNLDHIIPPWPVDPIQPHFNPTCHVDH